MPICVSLQHMPHIHTHLHQLGYYVHPLWLIVLLSSVARGGGPAPLHNLCEVTQILVEEVQNVPAISNVVVGTSKPVDHESWVKLSMLKKVSKCNSKSE